MYIQCCFLHRIEPKSKFHQNEIVNNSQYLVRNLPLLYEEKPYYRNKIASMQYIHFRMLFRKTTVSKHHMNN